MILAAIELENYKQYSGNHLIEFPEQGMIAITGPNGAGKTTLFEAIEWCLYGPRTIPLATIPPHGGVGSTVVRLTLEDPNDGVRHVVQRVLRNGLTSAEVYREDEPGQPVVQGPRDVTDFVTRQLIGLPHGAFVSTFFTRQKELTFFGDRAPTDRRVEVARLLGFDAIRAAQEDIGTEARQARNMAASLQSQYDRESAQHDFPQEIAAGECALVQARDREAETASQLQCAEQEAERARGQLEHWRGLQEQDSRLATSLAKLTGEMEAATSRQQSATAELARLDQLEGERSLLVGEAAAVEPLSFEVLLLDEQRKRSEALQSLIAWRDSALDRNQLAAENLRRIVEENRDAGEGLAGWSWSRTDEKDPEAAALRLLGEAAAVNPGEVRDRVEALRVALERDKTVQERSNLLTRYRALHENLAAARQTLLQTGEPRVAITAAETRMREARALQLAKKEELAATRTSRQESEQLAKQLRASSQEPNCPTCSRPLGPAEAERLAGVLDGNIKQLVQLEKRLTAEGHTAAETIAAAEADATEARNRQGELDTLNARLADGHEKLREAEKAEQQARADLAQPLRAAGLPSPPVKTDVETARVAADLAQRIADLRPRLERLQEEARESRQAAADSQTQIDDLGPITYDAAAHQTARTALDAAKAAAARIGQIEKELARRETYVNQLDSASSALAALGEQRTDTEQTRQELGFDAEALKIAQQTESNARLAARVARGEYDEARAALQRAQTELARIVEMRDRLQHLAEEADRRRRESDELDRMYREFAEFDKYVADHVGPLLAETTERLLDQVTEGKYDHVRFDENYGIEVFDGDECFKLEGFSGGERDVVALCARLAMSELVGSAAVRPPRFLVLDEVFGSLDSERRGQLLMTLGALSTTGHFQQMFIISHIDDVQQSPVMNEAWTVEERNGVSCILRPQSLVGAAS